MIVLRVFVERKYGYQRHSVRVRSVWIQIVYLLEADEIGHVYFTDSQSANEILPNHRYTNENGENVLMWKDLWHLFLAT